MFNHSRSSRDHQGHSTALARHQKPLILDQSIGQCLTFMHREAWLRDAVASANRNGAVHLGQALVNAVTQTLAPSLNPDGSIKITWLPDFQAIALASVADDLKDIQDRIDQRDSFQQPLNVTPRQDNPLPSSASRGPDSNEADNQDGIETDEQQSFKAEYEDGGYSPMILGNTMYVSEVRPDPQHSFPSGQGHSSDPTRKIAPIRGALDFTEPSSHMEMSEYNYLRTLQHSIIFQAKAQGRELKEAHKQECREAISILMSKTNDLLSFNTKLYIRSQLTSFEFSNSNSELKMQNDGDLALLFKLAFESLTDKSCDMSTMCLRKMWMFKWHSQESVRDMLMRFSAAVEDARNAGAILPEDQAVGQLILLFKDSQEPIWTKFHNDYLHTKKITRDPISNKIEKCKSIPKSLSEVYDMATEHHDRYSSQFSRYSQDRQPASSAFSLSNGSRNTHMSKKPSHSYHSQMKAASHTPKLGKNYTRPPNEPSAHARQKERPSSSRSNSSKASEQYTSHGHSKDARYFTPVRRSMDRPQSYPAKSSMKSSSGPRDREQGRYAQTRDSRDRGNSSPAGRPSTPPGWRENSRPDSSQSPRSSQTYQGGSSSRTSSNSFGNGNRRVAMANVKFRDQSSDDESRSYPRLRGGRLTNMFMLSVGNNYTDNIQRDDLSYYSSRNSPRSARSISPITVKESSIYSHLPALESDSDYSVEVSDLSSDDDNSNNMEGLFDEYGNIQPLPWMDSSTKPRKRFTDEERDKKLADLDQKVDGLEIMINNISVNRVSQQTELSPVEQIADAMNLTSTTDDGNSKMWNNLTTQSNANFSTIHNAFTNDDLNDISRSEVYSFPSWTVSMVRTPFVDHNISYQNKLIARLVRDGTIHSDPNRPLDTSRMRLEFGNNETQMAGGQADGAIDGILSTFAELPGYEKCEVQRMERMNGTYAQVDVFYAYVCPSRTMQCMIDSGAEVSVGPKKSMFWHLHKYNNSRTISGVSGDVSIKYWGPIIGVGNAIYLPSCPWIILSMSSAAFVGFKFYIDEDAAFIRMTDPNTGLSVTFHKRAGGYFAQWEELKCAFANKDFGETDPLRMAYMVHQVSLRPRNQRVDYRALHGHVNRHHPHPLDNRLHQDSRNQIIMQGRKVQVNPRLHDDDMREQASRNYFKPTRMSGCSSLMPDVTLGDHMDSDTSVSTWDLEDWRARKQEEDDNLYSEHSNSVFSEHDSSLYESDHSSVRSASEGYISDDSGMSGISDPQVDALEYGNESQSDSEHQSDLDSVADSEPDDETGYRIIYPDEPGNNIGRDDKDPSDDEDHEKISHPLRHNSFAIKRSREHSQERFNNDKKHKGDHGTRQRSINPRNSKNLQDSQAQLNSDGESIPDLTAAYSSDEYSDSSDDEDSDIPSLIVGASSNGTSKVKKAYHGPSHDVIVEDAPDDEDFIQDSDNSKEFIESDNPDDAFMDWVDNIQASNVADSKPRKQTEDFGINNKGTAAGYAKSSTPTKHESERIAQVQEIHEAMLHPSDQVLCHFIKTGSSNCNLTVKDVILWRKNKPFCATCATAKMKTAPQKPSKSSLPDTSDETMGLDIMQIPLYTPSGERGKYRISHKMLANGKKHLNVLMSLLLSSGMPNASIMVNKSTKAVRKSLAMLIKHAETRGVKVTAILTDREPAFVELAKHKEFPIVTNTSEGHSAGVERLIQSVKENFRCVLADVLARHGEHLPTQFYGRLAEHATILQSFKSTTNDPDESPFMKTHGTRPNFQSIAKAKFGQAGIFKIPNAQRPNNLSPSAELGIIVGFEPATPENIKVYLPSTKKIVIRRNFKPIPGTVREIGEHFRMLNNDQSDAQCFEEDLEHAEDDQASILAFYASLDDNSEACEIPELNTDDMTHKQALRSCPQDLVYGAFKTEIDGIIRLNCLNFCIPMDLPEDTVRIPCKVFYKNKFSANGSFIKLKARLVAGGHRQPPSSFNEISFNMIETSSVFTTISLAADFGYELHTLDVPQAYLHAPLNPEGCDTVHNIAIVFPKEIVDALVAIYPRMKKLVQANGTILALVLKSLYGLKQAGFNWFNVLVEKLIALGYSQSKSDRSLFLRHPNGDTKYYPFIITIHVDDLLILATFLEAQRIRMALQKDFGEMDMASSFTQDLSYLGMQILRGEDGRYLVNQEGYANRICKDFKITALHKTPSTGNLFSTADELSDCTSDITKYLSMLMSLMYLATKTRPDILKECVHLSSFSKNPGSIAFSKVQHVFGYINATKSAGIVLGGCGFQINVFCDASFAVHNDSKSHYGFKVTLGDNNGPIYVKSSKVKLVAESSTESELYAQNEAIRFSLPMIKLFEELGLYGESSYINVLQDNQSTMTIATHGEGYPGKSKSFRIRFHYISELVKEGIVKIQYIPTEAMEDSGADLLTKPVVGKKYQLCAAGLLNYDFNDSTM